MGLEKWRLTEAPDLLPEHVRKHVSTVTQCGFISTGTAGRLKLQFAARQLREEIATECKRSQDCVMRSAREWWETTSRATKQQVYWIVKAATDESWAEVTDIVFQPKTGSVAVFRFRLEQAGESTR
jgi:hypothetical protein